MIEKSFLMAALAAIFRVHAPDGRVVFMAKD